MVWNLLLAHFIGDFLIQTDLMVRNRDKFWVSVLHGGIHFAVMLLLIGESRTDYWSLVLLIALLHVGQDAVKIALVRRHPDWIKPAYFLDQILHFSTIWILVLNFQMGTPELAMTQKTAWVMVSISFLFVTYGWFITEKIIYHANPDLFKDIYSTKLSRMVARSGIVSIFLLIRYWAFPGLAIAFLNPYASTEYRQRFLLTDVSISIFTITFLIWALG